MSVSSHITKGFFLKYIPSFTVSETEYQLQRAKRALTTRAREKDRA